MKCIDIEELLSAYANDELPRTQREFVEEHLASCASCRATLADYTAVRRQLLSLRRMPAVSDIKEETMSKIKAVSFLRKPKQWMLPALVTVSIVAVLIALIALHPWSAFWGAQSVMAKAYAATSSLQSYQMTIYATSTYEEKTSEETSEWEFTSPDRLHAKITLDGETYEFIIVGDKQYVREPENASANLRISVSSSATPILSKENTLQILDALTDLQKLPDGEIEGVDCFHYRGRFDVEQIIKEQKAKLDPTQPGYEERLEGLEQLRGIKTEVELWIGKDDYLIRQMKRDTQVPADNIGGWSTSSSVVKYYDFDKPITIEPPVTASGELLPGWCLVDTLPTGPESNQSPYPSETPN
jgi:hypothetical protein